MKSASVEKRSELEAYFRKRPLPTHELEVFRHLHAVANTFIEVQRRREEADYDMA